MMFLTIDIGNTNTSVALWEKNKLLYLFKFSTDVKRNAKSYSLIFNKLLWSKVKFFVNANSRKDIKRVIIASVVPLANEELAKYLKNNIAEPLFVGAADFDIKVNYYPKSAVGADRIAASVAGMHLYKGNVLILDFGTAITIDVVRKDKTYLGGIILPGLNTAKTALIEKAALLKDFEIKKAESLVGNTTKKALVSGVYYGTICAVRGLLQQVKKELGFKKTTIVATGGDANIFAKELREIDFVNPDLVHIGLTLIEANMREKD